MRASLLLLLLVNLTSLSSSVFSDLHLQMSPEELDHYFGTSDHDQISSDYEIATFKQKRSPLVKRGGGSDNSLDFGFQAFGEEFDLPLLRSDHILAPTAVIVERIGETFLPFQDRHSSCHYGHQSAELVAAISVCGGEKKAVRGLVFTSSHMIEVHPLTSRLQDKIRHSNHSNHNDDGGFLSLVRRHNLADAEAVMQKRFNFRPVGSNNVRKRDYKQQAKRFVEIGIFVDKEAYTKYSQFFGGDKAKMTEFIVCYMNAVDALYKLPSLSAAAFSFTIVRLEFWSSQPDAVALDGNRELLYDQFCKFQSKETAASDDDPRHWDLALLLSGLDFYESATRSYVTMGLSFVGGICVPEYSCVIAELGATEAGTARQYPSTGMGSVMVAGHEIGHNLGVSHDKDPSGRCDKNKYIMSPSRGTKDKAAWSPCSAEVLSQADTPCLNDAPAPPASKDNAIPATPPGLLFGPRMQCVMFFLDDEAVVDNADSDISEVCSSVKCRSEKRKSGGGVKTGPALEGTPCGEGKWCNDGMCTDSPGFDTKTASTAAGSAASGVASGGTGASYWTEWSPASCKSGCLPGSKGYSVSTRSCVKKSDNGREIPADGCAGKHITFEFCDDSSVCGQREDITAYGDRRCKELSGYTNLIKKGGGKAARAAHNKKTLWPACAIYCTNANEDGFYSPVVDVSNLPNIDPYYPDGTPCHEEGKEKFYCQRNLCLPEGARVARASADELLNAAGSAAAKAGRPLPQSLYDYFKLDSNLAPVGGSPAVEDGEDIEDNDEVMVKKT